MKKILLLLVVAFAMSASGNAQSLDNLFGRLVKKVTEKTGKSDDDNKNTENTKNSDDKDTDEDLLSIGKALFDEVLGGTSSVKKISEADLVGTWSYNGVACSLESEDMVAQLGSKIVTGKLEEKMNEYLLKVGVKKATTTIEFAKGGNCVIGIGNKNPIPGTYTLSEDGKNVNFLFMKGQVVLKSKIDFSSDGLVIDFDANKVLEVLKKIGVAANDYANKQPALQSQTSTTNMLTTMITLLEGYNGMRLGVRLVK